MYKATVAMRAWRACATILIMFLLAGCSSSLFTEDTKEELNQAKGDGGFDKACLGLNLSEPTLDVSTTRNLVRCLNSNGSLQSYHELVESLSDAQLQTVLNTLNSELINNRTRMRAVDASFQQMDERGILTRALDKLSKVLSNGKLIRSSVRLLRQGTSVEDGVTGPQKLNPDVLQSIKILSQELSRDAGGQYSTLKARANLADGLEMGVRTTSLSAYRAMVDGLRSDIPRRDSALGLRFFTERALDYFKTKIRGNRALGKMLLWGIEDGSLFEGFDHYYYSECEGKKPSECKSADSNLSVDAQTQAMEAFLRLLTLDKKEEVLAPMTRLFRVMDDPIECMAGTKKIPNADMYVMTEFTKLVPLDVPQWTMRTNLLKMKLANSMCRFPGDGDMTFNELMNVLRELARETDRDDAGNAVGFGRPLVTVAHFLKGLEVGDANKMSGAAKSDLTRYMNYPENERYRRFLIHWLGDKNRDVNAYTHLADVIAELSRPQRAVVGNMLYLLNVPAPGSKDRKDVQSAVRVMMASRSQLGGRSIYDVFSEAVLKVDVSTLYDLLLGASELIDLQDELALPLLETSRDALLMNDANPVVEIALSLGYNAEKHEHLFQTLFDIADTDKFEAAMQLTARMAQNGTLRELTKGLLMMFSGHTKGIAAPNPQNVLPVKLADPSRDRSTRNRPAWRPLPAYWPQDPARVQACYDINVDLPFGNPFPGTDGGRVEWERQMGKIASCVNANGQNAELESFLNYGIRQKMSGGKSFLGKLTELLADFIPSGGDQERLKNVYDELSDLMTENGSFADLKAMNGILPFLFDKQYCSTEFDENFTNPSCARGSDDISVMQGLARSFSVIAGETEKVQKLLNVGRLVVEDRRMPKTVALNYDIGNEAERRAADPKKFPVVADEKPPLISYPLNHYPRNTFLADQLKENIRKHEGIEPTPEIIEKKEQAYFSQVLPGEIKEYEDYKGEKRPGYKNHVEFKASIKPLLDELSKGDRLKATLTFFYRMQKDPYTPEWWAGWFRRLSANVIPIPYYYKGTQPPEHKPTVRMVSQLELLDLVVNSADFTLKEVGQKPLNLVDENHNFAIKYLTLLALCGNDMRPAVDPMGRELDTFDGMLEIVNKIPSKWLRDQVMTTEVRRRTFNLKYIYPILKKLDKVTEFTNSDGTKVYANDLGVLRDLFKAVLKALPKEVYRNYDVTYPKLVKGDAIRYTDFHEDMLFDRKVNPLAIIAEMVRFGLLRNSATNMWYVHPKSKLSTKVAQGRHQDNTSELKSPLHQDDRRENDTRENRHVVPQEVSQVLKFLTEAAVSRDSNGINRLNLDAVAVLRHLVTADCDRTSKAEYRDLPCVVAVGQKDPRSFDERYVFFGKFFREFFEWIEDDDRLSDKGQTRVMSYIKRTGHQASRLLDRLAGDNRARHEEFIKQLVKVLKPALGRTKGTAFLGDNLDGIESLFSDSEAVHYLDLLLSAEKSSFKWPEANYTEAQGFADMRGLVDTLMTTLAADDSAASANAIDLLYILDKDPMKRFKSTMNALDWMKADADYVGFKHETLARVNGQIIHWLPKEAGQGNARALRPRLQEHLGAHLGNGDVRELITFIGNQSIGTTDTFYNQIKFVGKRQSVEDLNAFLELLRAGIVDNYPPKQ